MRGGPIAGAGRRSTTARNRAIVAIVPRSRYRNGLGSVRADGARSCAPRGGRSAWRPPPRRVGRSRPIRSPTTNSSGYPGSEQSGSTATRPARSTSAPARSASIRPSGEACTPAAQIFVRASMRPGPSPVATSRPASSTPTTRVPRRTSTPSRSRSRWARRRSRSGYGAARCRRASSSTIRAALGSKRRKLPAAPGVTALRSGPRARRRWARHRRSRTSATARGPPASGSSSAISKAPKMRPRSSRASSIVFMPGAWRRVLVMAEIRRRTPGRDDQAVVRQRGPFPSVSIVSARPSASTR